MQTFSSVAIDLIEQLLESASQFDFAVAAYCVMLDQATDDVIRYILENPIRAGLAAKFGEYPYAGSGVYRMSDLAEAWERQTSGL